MNGKLLTTGGEKLGEIEGVIWDVGPQTTVPLPTRGDPHRTIGTLRDPGRVEFVTAVALEMLTEYVVLADDGTKLVVRTDVPRPAGSMVSCKVLRPLAGPTPAEL